MAKIVALLCQALFPPSKRVNGEAGGTMPGTEPSLAERWVRIEEDEKVEFGFGQNRSKSKSSSRRRLSRPFRFVPDRRLLSRRSARSQTKDGSIVMTRADDATDDGPISQPHSSSFWLKVRRHWCNNGASLYLCPSDREQPSENQKPCRRRRLDNFAYDSPLAIKFILALPSGRRPTLRRSSNRIPELVHHPAASSSSSWRRPYFTYLAQSCSALPRHSLGLL